MRMLESIKWDENFEFDDLRFWGVLPIKTLIEKIVETDSVGEEKKHPILCDILKENIDDLDKCVVRIDSEQRKARQAQS